MSGTQVTGLRERRRAGRLLARVAVAGVAAVGLLLLGPLGVLALGDLDLDTHWSAASRESSGLAPRPEAAPEPVLQVYGARTYNWRGAFGIHTWIAAKRQGADEYTVYHVIGWNLRRGRSVVTVSRGGPADFYWFNARPQLLAERRGQGVEALIDRVEQAVAAYPYPDRYRAWPGPNSNTFTAFVARRVPELGLDLPPTAIGKDWLPGELPRAHAQRQRLAAVAVRSARHRRGRDGRHRDQPARPERGGGFRRPRAASARNRQARPGRMSGLLSPLGA